MYEVHSSSSSILHRKISQPEWFKRNEVNGHYSIYLNMKNGGLLQVNPILYMPYYNTLLFASMEGLDHKKAVALGINLPLWHPPELRFTEEIRHSYFISPFYFGTVWELSFTAFLFAPFVPNVLARLTSLSPVCGKHIYVLYIHFSYFALLWYTTALPPQRKIEPLPSWKPWALHG